MKNKVIQIILLFPLMIVISITSVYAQKTISNQTIEPNQEEVNLFPLTDCSQSTAQIDLDINNVRARLRIGGDLWWDDNNAIYQVPQNSGVSTIFSGGLWMGGIDPGGSLKLSAQTYGSSNGAFDYTPGPLNEIGTTSQDQCSNFDRFWEVTSEAINTHKADWDDNGVIDGPVPNSILAWAGVGNPNSLAVNGFELPDSPDGLAPFFDRNANGIYEPMLGEYPKIKNADQAVWWVFNDAGNIHTQSGGDRIQMETQVLAYAYASSDIHINNATFYDYKFINKAIEAIDSFYVGLWVDFDLGCFSDDYVGCDPDQGLAYVYNQDALDGESSCADCQGVATFCEDIPMAGIKLLKGPLVPKVFDVDANGNQILRNPYIGEIGDTLVELGLSNFMAANNTPNDLSSYYNLLSGSFADGTRLTAGGNGYDPLSTDYTNFAYPDPPNDPEGWSMCSENIPSADRRIVMSAGPYQAIPQSSNTISFAVIYAEGASYPCPDLSPLEDACAAVTGHFDNIVNTKEALALMPANIKFQPNPMTHQAELIFDDLENKVRQVEIFSVDGKLVHSYQNIRGNTLKIQGIDLNSGIYFYKLLTEDFKIYSDKFIVQK